MSECIAKGHEDDVRTAASGHRERGEPLRTVNKIPEAEWTCVCERRWLKQGVEAEMALHRGNRPGLCLVLALFPTPSCRWMEPWCVSLNCPLREKTQRVFFIKEVPLPC